MQNKFEGKNTFKILTVQSLPMAAAYIITATASIVAYALLKNMPDMSVYALSIAGYAGVLVIRNILAAVFDGAFTSGTVLVAEAYGKQNQRQVWSISIHMVAICLVAGFALSGTMWVFGYPLLVFCTADAAAADLSRVVFAFMMLTTPLWTIGMMMALLLRGVGDVRYSSIMNMISAVVFVVLAAVLIPRYGVMGAAVASVFSFGVINTVFYSIVITSGKSAIKPLGRVNFDKALVKDILKLAWPISVRSLIEQLGAAILVSSISSYGVVFLAAWQTSKDIMSFGSAPGNASYATSSAIVSARQGVREGKQRQEDLLLCMKGFFAYAVAVSVAAAAVLLVLSPWLPGWITTEADVAVSIVEMVPVFIATIVFGNIGSSMSGMLQGLKKTKSVAAISTGAAVLCYWVYPNVMIFFGFGYLWVVAAQLVAAVIRDVLYYVMLCRELRRDDAVGMA